MIVPKGKSRKFILQSGRGSRVANYIDSSTGKPMLVGRIQGGGCFAGTCPKFGDYSYLRKRIQAGKGCKCHGQRGGYGSGKYGKYYLG